MKNLIEKGKHLFLKYKTQILYLFFGGLTTLVNIIIFFILNTLLKIDYQISNVIAWIIVVIFAYITNKIWVFESKTKSKKDLLRETSSFVIARLITLGVEFVLLYLFIEKMFMLEIVAKIIINVIVIVLNYIFSKLFIFNGEKKNISKSINMNRVFTVLGIIIVIITVISLISYKYDISEKGYSYSYALNEYKNPGVQNIGDDLGNQLLGVDEGDTLEQYIYINEGNAEYLYIFFNENEDMQAQTNYIIKISDIYGNVLIEKTINEKHIYSAKYKLDIKGLSKGMYMLSITCSGKNNFFAPTYNPDYESNFKINNITQQGIIDVAIFYRENNNYFVLYTVIAIITIIYLIIAFILLKYNKMALHNKFLILAIPIYTIFLILIPPISGHDESLHWFRIFEITEGNLTSQIVDNKAGSVLPKAVYINVPWQEYFKYIDFIEQEPTYMDYEETEFVSSITMTVYSPIQYLPQVIGVTISKLLTNNSIIIFYMGRIFNMIFCIGILYLAIKKIPYLKKLLFLFAFIPIAIEGFCTLTGDGPLIAISYYFLAYILSIINSEKGLSKKDYIILYALGLFLAFSKLVYIPLIALLFLIPKSKFKNKKDKIIKLSIMIFIFLTVNFIWLKIANKYLEIYTIGKSNDQISFILSNPFKYFQILLSSFENEGFDLILQAFGKYLLWGETLSNNTLVPLTAIIACLIVIFNEKTQNVNNKFANILILLISIIIIILIFTSIFIQWTRFGDIVIRGVQGRYFIPILPLIFILLSHVTKYKAKLKTETLDKIIIYVSLFICYMTALELLAKFI